MNYPDGLPDKFEFCILEGGKEPVWQENSLEGSWFLHAFIGSMTSLMRRAEGSETTLPTSVEDVTDTMAVIEAVCSSSAEGGEALPRKEQE